MLKNLILTFLILSTHQGIGVSQFFIPRYIHTMEAATFVDAVDLEGDGTVEVLFDTYDDFLKAEPRNGGYKFNSLKHNLGGEDLKVTDPQLDLFEVADLNNDNLMDFVVGDGMTNLIIYLQTPQGMYSKTILHMGLTNKVEPVVIDIDGDGDKDIVVLTGNKVLVYLNNGSTTFELALTYQMLATEKKLFFYDITKDGIPEIGILHDCSTTIYHLRFHNFDPSSQQFEYLDKFAILRNESDHGIEIPEIDFYDIEGDGDIDILSSWSQKYTIHESINDGNLNFTKTIYPIPEKIYEVYPDDIDGDNVAELVTTYYKNITIYKKNVLDVYEAIYIHEDGEGISTLLKFIDYDNDGDKDFVGNYFIENVENWSSIKFNNIGYLQANKAIPANLDQDPLPEFVMHGFNQFSILEQNNQGRFELFNMAFPYMSNIIPVQYDVDEELEIITYYTNDSLYLYDKQDSLTYSQRFLFRTVANNLTNIIPADVDHDGDVDIVHFSKQLSRYLEWYENMVNDQFVPHLLYSEKWGVNDASVIDFDKDGDFDIVAVILFQNSFQTHDSGQLHLFRNNGSGVFSDTIIYQEYNSDFRDMFIHDFNKDGEYDLIITGLFQGKFESKILIKQYNDAYLTKLLLVKEPTHGFIQSNGQDFFFYTSTEQVYWYILDPFFNQEIHHIPIEFAKSYYIIPFDLEDDGDDDLFVKAEIKRNPPNVDGQFLVLENAIADSIGILSISVFIDGNKNGIKEFEEQLFGEFSIRIDPLHIEYIGVEGELSRHLEIDTYHIQLKGYDHAIWENTTGGDLMTVVIDKEHLNPTVSFGLAPRKLEDKVYIDLIASRAICNRVTNHYAFFKNTGTIPIDSALTIFTFPPELQYTEAFPQPHELLQQEVRHQLLNFSVNERFLEEIRLMMPDESHFNDWFGPESTIYRVEQGVLHQMSHDSILYQLNCAIDPNDISVFPKYVTPGYILSNPTQLDYIIRFQNLGSIEAENVRIENILPPELQLDSFKLLSTSHPDIIESTLFLDQRKLQFDFLGIHLADSSSSWEESQGFVKYRIYSQNNLALNEKINNHAKIFFDLNQPLATNVELNTVSNCEQLNELFIDVDSTQLPFIYSLTFSNPILDSLHWTLNGTFLSDSANIHFPVSPDLITHIHLRVFAPLCPLDTTLIFGTTAIDDQGDSDQLIISPQVASDHIHFFLKGETKKYGLRFNDYQ